MRLFFIYFDYEKKRIYFFKEIVYHITRSELFDMWCRDQENSDDSNHPRIYQEISIETLLTHENPSYREWARKKLS